MNIQIACIWEVLARKMGNVHPRASFSQTTYYDFLLSAAVIAPILESPQRTVGELVLECVRAVKRHVRQNTNLGIILLLAPLVKASNETQLKRVLEELSLSDAELTYEAIRLANPGGLGESTQQDVRQKPSLSLLEAMRLAADRDFIARQYVTSYQDVFNFGIPKLLEGMEIHGCVEASIIHAQIGWLAEFPDSLIVRKSGLSSGIKLQEAARSIQSLGGLTTPAGRLAGVRLDQYLRQSGNKLNPGTTADLITASLYIAVRDGKLNPNMPFFWTVSDWL